MEERLKKILVRLQAQCVKREYCVQDIRKKALDKCEGDVQAAEEIVASLVADRFVSDLRYAGAYAREKSAISGWGPAKIRYALSAKHISRSDIDAALEEIDTERSDARLVKLMEHKWKSLEGDPQAKLKLLRYALSRGYGYDQVKDIADRITSQSASDDI